MTRGRSHPERIVSAASMQGIWLELPVDRAALTDYLRRYGPLKIDPKSGPDRERSWVSIEVWTVTNGRLVVAGADQHDTVARWAGIGAGFFGAAWGASLAWMATLPSGDLRSATASMSTGAKKGFELGATLAGKQARAVSRAFTLGPYHELVVGVPNVSLGGVPGRYVLVAGMVTDDATAQSIDRYFGYGYQKQSGTFEIADDGSARVGTGRDSSVSIEMADTRRVALDPKSVLGSALNRRWSLPLLGGLHDGRWTASWLQRSVAAPGATASRVLGKVVLRGSLAGIPLSGSHSLRQSPASGARAVIFKDVSALISRPSPAAVRAGAE